MDKNLGKVILYLKMMKYWMDLLLMINYMVGVIISIKMEVFMMENLLIIKRKVMVY